MLVPNEVDARSLTVCALVEGHAPASSKIVVDPGSIEAPLSNQWKEWRTTDGQLGVSYARVTIPSLSPATTYALRLVANGAKRAAASVRTLPAELPGLDAPPFVVMLGSCFCQANDRGALGRTLAGLTSALFPDIKILCGDQAYLDSPWSHYLTHTHTPAELSRRLYDRYRTTWFQEGTPGEFRRLLSEGANFFAADDHELWNNAPNAATVIRDSWTRRKREAWTTIARGLFEAFQTTRSRADFSVKPVSLCVLDSRWNRTADRKRFSDPADLDFVRDWVRDLAGPGVLVIGQPVFEEAAGFFGRFTDWKLPDYEQYGPLASLLLSSRHSLVVLTGDVHFGRIASCRLPSGAELIEIISSPMALVDEKAKGGWSEAPGRFPAQAVPGAVRMPTRTNLSFTWNHNHFMTLEFAMAGTRVRLAVKAWKIPPDGASSPWEQVETFLLS